MRDQRNQRPEKPIRIIIMSYGYVHLSRYVNSKIKNNDKIKIGKVKKKSQSSPNNGGSRFTILLIWHFPEFADQDIWPNYLHLRNKSHSGPENLKKSRQKKLVKSIKINYTKICFDQIPFFAISKMAKNQFLNWEKV